MSEHKIARTVAEAQVGDLLWVCPDRWRKCEWQLWPVRKVGRLYAYVGESDGEWSWIKTAREHPYDDSRAVMGWQQREAQHVRQRLERDIEQRIRVADLETLKTVAFALGLEGAPDFSVAPNPTPGA